MSEVKQYLRLRPQDGRDPDKSVRVMLLALSDVGIIRHRGGEFLVPAKPDALTRLDQILSLCGYCADIVRRPA